MWYFHFFFEHDHLVWYYYLAKKMNKISTIFNLGEHEESGPYGVFIFTDINEGFLYHFDSAANKTSIYSI